MSNLIRGVISNGVGLLVLAITSWAMDLAALATVSLVINWSVFFVHAFPRNSEKLFDATGSLTYLTLAVSATLSKGSSTFGVDNLRQIVNPVMMTVWCIRLGSFLFARIQRDGKDSRFDEFKKHWLRFLGVWTIQSIWCFFVASPVLVVTTSKACATNPGALDLVGWCIWIFGFSFEVIADQQKKLFRADPANKDKFISSGLWALSRHPNYFGEITMWVGICVSGSSCFHNMEWLAWLSPVTTLLLLLKVSGVPLLEAQGEKRWGADPSYQWYMKHTPCILPACSRPPTFKGEPLLSK